MLPVPLLLALVGAHAASPLSLPVPAPVPAEPGVYAEALQASDLAALDPDGIDVLLEDMSSRAPAGTRSLRLLAPGPDGQLVPVRQLLPEPPPVPAKEGGRATISAPVDHPGAVQGALSGKAVYVSQCHGYIYYSSLGTFSTQRGNLFETVEDFHNPEGANLFLVRYLENMGARVFTARERDVQPLMAIADNDGSGYSETGAGFADGLSGFAQPASLPYGTDPFDEGTTRTFPSDGGGVATWEPTVPDDGYYAVYVTWDADPAHATDAHYRLTHPGGVIDRTYDQTVHGSTWQYVETLWLTAGNSLTVELIGDSATSQLLSADAVRIGGGWSEVSRQGQIPDRPRWETGAIQYTQYNGAPTSVYDPDFDGTVGDGGSDPRARSRWAEWEHPAGEDAVYLSWHSNASAYGTARGTVTYWAGSECSNPAVAGADDLASLVQDELITSITTLWSPTWNDRGTSTACFSEVSPTHNDEMPSALVELAFHDNADDVAYLKDPVFRDDASRAMARGIARYFAERDGQAVTFPPEPPVGVQLVHEGGELVARWAPGPTGAPFGDAATSYRVYRSSDGRSFDNGTDVTGTSYEVPADVGETVFLRVAAVNDGGVSFGSELVGGRRAASGLADVLVVGAFDRLDAGLLEDEYKSSTVGTVKRFLPHQTNHRDTVRTHGLAIADAGYTFDFASDEAAESLDWTDYAVVVWAAGEESTVDETFSASQQSLVSLYLDAGGALWASGAEILWDLDERGDSLDQAFALTRLGATMEADAAASDAVDGEGVLAGIQLDFGPAWGGDYPVEYPDVLDSTRPVVARYGDGGVAGILGEGVALFGFPFDAVGDRSARTDAAAALLAELAPTVVPQGTGTLPDSGDTGLVSDTGEPTDTVDTGGGPGPSTGSTYTPSTTPGTEPDAAPAPPPAEEKGCGCEAAGRASIGYGALLGVLLVARRRRH